VAYASSVPQALQGRETASYGARAGAYLIDSLIFILLLFTVVGWIFVPALVMARKGEHNGQTWGKQAVGITVIKENGGDWSFGDAFVREWVVKWLLFGFVGGFFFFTPFVDLLWPLWDERDQALHDKLVSSYVVKV
jgi:uncharacterized RDD family membrane protein YckC